MQLTPLKTDILHRSALLKCVTNLSEMGQLVASVFIGDKALELFVFADAFFEKIAKAFVCNSGGRNGQILQVATVVREGARDGFDTWVADLVSTHV